MMAAYVMLICAGIAIGMSPPPSVRIAFDWYHTITMAIFFVAGGVMGMIGCAKQWFYLERSGILSANVGLLLYSIAQLSFMSANGPDESRWAVIFVILAGIALMYTRYFRLDWAYIYSTNHPSLPDTPTEGAKSRV